jgi:hypothetical protein
MFKNEKGMSSITMLMGLLICTIAGLQAEMIRQQFSLRSNKHAAVDFQSQLTQTTMILSLPEMCRTIFNGKRLEELESIRSTDRFPAEASIAFSFDSHLYHQKIVEARIEEPTDVFSDGRTFLATLRLVGSKDGLAYNTRAGSIPIYLSLDGSGRVSGCHATTLTDGNVPIEDAICNMVKPSSKYEPSSNGCRLVTVTAGV